jgi:zinc transporter 1/2/3
MSPSAVPEHSFFETMALGISNDMSSALVMMLSIASHQPAESLSLLLALLKTNLSMRSKLFWLGLFSLIGPLGVSVGLLVQKVCSPVIEAIIVSLIAGSFMYIGATEVRLS